MLILKICLNNPNLHPHIKSFTKTKSAVKWIERWKIQCKLWWLPDSFTCWILTTFYDHSRKIIYRRLLQHLLKLHSGELKLTHRVAVLVVFQPQGLLRLPLDHLRENWGLILVLSNQRLTVPDRAKVLSRFQTNGPLCQILAPMRSPPAR